LLRVDEEAARPRERPEVALQLAHRLDGFVAGPVLGAARHAAQQLVEHRQGGVGQAFLKADAGCRQRRMAAQGIEFAKVLGCDATAFVRQPVKSQSRDHVGTGAIEAQRADIGEPFDQAQDVARCRRLWRIAQPG
jgi:hypothetical protein